MVGQFVSLNQRSAEDGKVSGCILCRPRRHLAVDLAA